MSSNPSLLLLRVQTITQHCQKMRVKCIAKTKQNFPSFGHPECLVDWDYCCPCHWKLVIRVWVILSVWSKKLCFCQPSRQLGCLHHLMGGWETVACFLLSWHFLDRRACREFSPHSWIQILLGWVAIWKLVFAGAIHCKEALRITFKMYRSSLTGKVNRMIQEVKIGNLMQLLHNINMLLQVHAGLIHSLHVPWRTLHSADKCFHQRKKRRRNLTPLPFPWRRKMCWGDQAGILLNSG